MAATLATSRRAARPHRPLFARWPAQAAAALVVGTVVGVYLAGSNAEGFFWLSLAEASWLVGTVWAFTRERLALAFAGLQAFMLISVILPAADAYLRTGVNLFGVRYTTGIVDGLQMIALAQLGLTVGAMLIHLRPIDDRPRYLEVQLPWRRVDRLMVGLAAMGVLSLIAFTVLSGASLSKINVFAGDTNYGDLNRSATGPQVAYFLTLQSLVGTAMVLAVLRLTGKRSRYVTLPLVVLLFGVAFLAMSGQRQRLLVPLCACGLIWWKTAGGQAPKMLRTIAVVGGLGLFTLSSFVNVLRNDSIDSQAQVKSTDITAVLNDQVGQRSNLFATTVGLAENVPAKYPYIHGVSYAELAVLPIPRALWKDKPVGRMPELQGNFFDTRIGASFPEYGEMYANFGLAGVAVGCLGFGALVEYLWVRLSRTEGLTGLLWLSVAVPIALLLFTRNYAAGIIAGQFGVFAGVWVSLRAIKSWRRRDLIETTLRT